MRSDHWLASSLKLAARCPVSGCWPSCFICDVLSGRVSSDKRMEARFAFRERAVQENLLLQPSVAPVSVTLHSEAEADNASLRSLTNTSDFRRLSWLSVSFWAHKNIVDRIVSYRIVSGLATAFLCFLCHYTSVPTNQLIFTSHHKFSGGDVFTSICL